MDDERRRNLALTLCSLLESSSDIDIEENDLLSVIWESGLKLSEEGPVIRSLFDLYKGILNIFPDNVAVMNNLGLFLLRLGFQDMARDYFQKCLTINPYFLQAARNLNSILISSVERWHFKMLNDKQRNESFREAIMKKINQGFDRVLDVGTGTGLLSLYCIDGKAKEIYACDSSPAMAEIAQDVFHSNNATSINLINKELSKIRIPIDIDKKVSLLVTETFDVGLLGEHVLQIMLDAWNHLLEPPPCQSGSLTSEKVGAVIPQRAILYVTGIEFDEMANDFHLKQTIASDMFETRKVLQCWYYYDSQDLSRSRFTCLTETKKIFEINFNDTCELRNYIKGWSEDMTLKCKRSGRLDCFALWFDLHLDEDIFLSTCPHSKANGAWDQAVFPLPRSTLVRQNQDLNVTVELYSLELYINLKGVDIYQPMFRVPDKVIRILNDEELAKGLHQLANKLASKFDKSVSVLDCYAFPFFGLNFLKNRIGKFRDNVWCITSTETNISLFRYLNEKHGVDITPVYEGHVTRVAKDMSSFLSCIEVEKFDVILLDFFETNGEIKSKHFLDNIRSFLKPGGIILPQHITVIGQFIYSDWLTTVSKVINDSVTCGYNIAEHINKYQVEDFIDFYFKSLDYNNIYSSPVELFNFFDSEESITEMSIPCMSASALVNAMVYWYKIKFTEDCDEILTKDTTYYHQAAFVFSKIESTEIKIKIIRNAGRKDVYREIINEPYCQTLIFDQEELHITGYKNSIVKKCIFYILSVVLCGTPALILYWYPQLIYLKNTKTSFRSCNYVLIKDSNNCCFVHPVNTVNIPLDETSASFQKMLFSVLKIDNEIKFFLHKDIRYIWVDKQMEFQKLRGWDDGIKCVKELEKSLGYTEEEQKILLKIYGENKIDILVPSYWKILEEEILQPFYLFQFFSIILWLVNDYISYAICVVFLTSFSISVTLYTTKKQRKSLETLVHKSSPGTVFLTRKDGEVEEVDPSVLVPGDIIEIPRNGFVMPCDAVLLHGNCIVNEYILTGESSPVLKTPPICSNNLFNSIIMKRHVLFCGTQIVQTRYYGKGTVTAVTVSTGFSTMKGELIRCLLHPKPLGFKFHEDSVKFVFCLFLVATGGIFYLCYIFYNRQMSFRTLVLDSLDLITIVVPPALPAALSAGVAYSRSRLLSKGIFCISPPKINVFGKLKLMCFDKTGTLTEEGLDLWGVLPCSRKEFTTLIEKPSVLHPKHPLVVALAACHSLTIIEGKICGNPLDLSMFKSLNWDLHEPGLDTSRYDLLCPAVVKPKFYTKAAETENINSNFLDRKKIQLPSNLQENLKESLIDSQLPYEIGIVREFPFTSESRCMSVITRQLGASHMNLYFKGAPEKIWEICVPDSVPKNFNEELQIYTSMGFRVLGVAYKEFDNKFTWRKAQRVKRRDVENRLIFIGLIIMQNKLKSVSTGVMNDLRMANIRCIMITGDNLLTAVSVSRECLMILPGDIIIEVKVTPPDGCKSGPSLSFHPVGSINQMELSKLMENDVTPKTSGLDYHYVMDGKTWELLKTYFRDLIPKIIVKGTVFARMLPEQKKQLVESFQDLDYIIGMCGDGANDYGAMKVAHVGVSLSETESSVVAPFTSKVQDVSCIVSLVQEGRCALISTFVIFKYMTIYSLIQFMSVLIVYGKGVSFSNAEFLYVDLIVTSLLAVVIGRAGPSKVVVKTRPIARLMSFGNLFPLLLQVFVLFTVQMSALKFLRTQKWFTAVVPDSEAITDCWENTVVYCTSLFQYLTLALVFSKGKPYRQPFYNDVLFMIIFIAMTAFAIILCVWPFNSLARLFEILPVEEDTQIQTFFRLQLLIFPVVNLLLSFLIEVLFNEKKWLKNITHLVTRKKESKNRYKRILHDSLYQRLWFVET